MFEDRKRGLSSSINAFCPSAGNSARESRPNYRPVILGVPVPRPRRTRLRRTLRRMLPEHLVNRLRQALTRTQIKVDSVLDDPMQFRRPSLQRECPLCGFQGRFWTFGAPPRSEALCPRCLSLERHRLFHLLVDRYANYAIKDKRVLHFAPEPCVRARLGRMSRYVTADLSVWDVDCQCAMESIPFPDNSLDAVIANHVLEHVDNDLDAMREVRSVLKPEGAAILSVPIVQGWDETYENPDIATPEMRRTHFGQEDHKRLYGRDFHDRLRQAGFVVEIFRADPEREIRFGLRRGDQFFVARPRSDRGRGR